MALLACCTATQESVEADFAVHTSAVLGPPSASPLIYAALRAAHDRCNLMERPPRRQKMNMRHHVARVLVVETPKVSQPYPSGRSINALRGRRPD